MAQVDGYEFTLSGMRLTAFASGALWCEQARLLAVSDLHLGRSERIARLGGALLPPYEVQDTLLRLDADIASCNPRVVVCLGDSFDDMAAAELADGPLLWLSRLMAGRRWVWIAGNHDPAPVALAGEHRKELAVGPLIFRHIAEPGSQGEVSGHYHPKFKLSGQALRCFLADGARVVMPAYGTYTGGMEAHDPVIAALFKADALAILTGALARPVPLFP